MQRYTDWQMQGQSISKSSLSRRCETCLVWRFAVSCRNNKADLCVLFLLMFFLVYRIFLVLISFLTFQDGTPSRFQIQGTQTHWHRHTHTHTLSHTYAQWISFPISDFYATVFSWATVIHKRTSLNSNQSISLFCQSFSWLLYHFVLLRMFRLLDFTVAPSFSASTGHDLEHTNQYVVTIWDSKSVCRLGAEVIRKGEDVTVAK